MRRRRRSRPRPADVGKTVTVAVTGSKTGYESATRTSAPSAPVALGNLTATPFPTVIGRPRVGDPLTAAPGTWDTGVTFAYQWSVNDMTVTDTTGYTFTPRRRDLGQAITVSVTGNKDGYAASTRISGTGVTVCGPHLDPDPRSPAPRRSGTPSPPRPAPGTTASPCPTNGRTTRPRSPTPPARHSPPAENRPHHHGLRHRPQDGYAAATRTSATTAPVAPAARPSTPIPTISGTPQVGYPLTAARGTWEVGVTLHYRMVGRRRARRGRHRRHLHPRRR